MLLCPWYPHNSIAGTHLEFLPAIKAIIRDGAAVSTFSTFHAVRGEAVSDFSRNELISKGPTVKPTATPAPPRSEPPERGGARDYAARTAPPRRSTGFTVDLSAAPVLAIEDLVFDEREANRGGMGMVKKAVYRRGTEVAVKELVPQLAKTTYDFFLREMRVHFSIPPSPHIVPVRLGSRRSVVDPTRISAEVAPRACQDTLCVRLVRMTSRYAVGMATKRIFASR